MASADNTPGAHYAIARTGTSSNKYLGAGAGISIHNPPAFGRQYSAARVKIQNGPDSIEVGWRVDPSLYGDSRTRLFVRLDAGESHCFNTRCPGFVLVRSDMPVDMVFSDISQPGTSDIFVVPAYYVRDQVNGNWWLEFGLDNTEVGFWPKALFTGLGDLANYVEWGGEGGLTPEEFLDWVAAMDEVLEFKQVPEDKRVSLVATRFRGRAAAWWQQLKQTRLRQGKDKISSWEKLKKKMRGGFSSPQLLASDVSAAAESSSEFAFCG
ncbi:hypothetical protein Vadar_025932 [Vaccinium darrowii]|uniref:Uncharacterized protein n=1 Tax=Vaccinium darrowii TaxID=229202 RepID=A0ACB7XUM7_9ERIC|nr:hypothetical protein Vadar_025932 [Vaccinium darrowii]